MITGERALKTPFLSLSLREGRRFKNSLKFSEPISSGLIITTLRSSFIKFSLVESSRFFTLSLPLMSITLRLLALSILQSVREIQLVALRFWIKRFCTSIVVRLFCPVSIKLLICPKTYSLSPVSPVPLVSPLLPVPTPTIQNS